MLGQSGSGSPNAAAHRAAAKRVVTCAVVTVSDTRTLDTDKSGALVNELLIAAGHEVKYRTIVADEPVRIQTAIQQFVAAGVEAIAITGGTGISPRDQTFETVAAMLTKPLPGYGELFRMLSFEEIGAAAMLSRAVAGLVHSTVVLTMPGSTAAVRLAMEKLILPELGHMASEATKR